jgi:radical SAM superfamily enzyme YgiQ (UPF0313 family)
MKILLVYPSQLDENGQVMKYHKAYMPPLSLAILNSLTPGNHDVTVVNDMVEEIDFEGDYDLVSLSAMTVQTPRTYQIADRFRARGVKVVIGGIHASCLSEEAGQHADSVVIGEVETVWESLLADLEEGNLNDCYLSEGHPSLDRLVIPKWTGFNMQSYRKSAGSKMPRMPIFTTRGCLYNCSFCAVSKAYGRTHRHKPVENVLKEIDATGADAYFFVDDNIVCDFDYAADLFRALLPKKIRWMSQASMQLLKRPDLIDLAALSGCKSLFLGIESISPDVLKGMKKGFNQPDSYPEFFDRLNRAGIRPLVSIIIGLDQDTPEDIERTLDFLIQTRVSNVYLNIYTPLPGTDLYTEMAQDGRLLERNWSRYDLSHVVHQPLNFTPEHLEKTYWQLYERLYCAGAITKRTLGGLTGLRNGPGKMIRDLLAQVHMHRQIRNREHPLSMGLGRVKS